jgi:hypothetical protein
MSTYPLVTSTLTKAQLKTKAELCRQRQEDVLRWLDGLITEAERIGSPVIVVGTAVAKGIRQQINDSLKADI